MHLTAVVAAAILGFSALTSAHPGQVHQELPRSAALQLRDYKDNTRRGLAACEDKLKRDGFYDRAIARRQATLDKHSKRKRDTATVLATNHLSNDSSINENTPETVLFASNETCVLTPEGEIGPFYVPGEYIRSDLSEDQPGVPVVLEGQFVDVTTCEPITGLWWDLWNCNSTGVYSGVLGNGNGDENDLSNINATFLRGIQETDSDGVVTFQTIFPGHYAGRSNHHHLVAYLNVTTLPNNTITGGEVAHIGQMFWDSDLVDKVEATYPYNQNTITLTTNAEDRVFAVETVDTTSDPVFEYVYIGDDLSDGLFGWMTFAVNVSATYDTSYSFVYTAGGGVAESSGGTGTTGGGGGTAPSGSRSAGAGPSGI